MFRKYSWTDAGNFLPHSQRALILGTQIQIFFPMVGMLCMVVLLLSFGGVVREEVTKATKMSNFVNWSGRRISEYGRTYVVRPKGKTPSHNCLASWPWRKWVQIKWICPTAPTRPVTAFGGFTCTAWFDVGELSADGPDDIEGLDTTAAHVANLLSTEPANIKLGVGGFSIGAATAVYSATCFVTGRYNNGNPYPINLSAVVGLSTWLPCSRNLKNKIQGSQESIRRAASFPLLLSHGKGDDVVLYKHGHKSAEILSSTGFRNLSFRTYNGLGHYTVPEEMEDVCRWLTAKLGLDRSRS